MNETVKNSKTPRRKARTGLDPKRVVPGVVRDLRPNELVLFEIEADGMPVLVMAPPLVKLDVTKETVKKIVKRMKEL